MTGFQNKWSKPPTPGLTERINDALKPKGSLKPRVEMAIKRLKAQISKLDNMLSKLKERDEKIFQRVVIATQQHDTQTSKVLSNELAEIRKVSKILGNARMALEQIELRLTTAHDLGDTVVTIMPTIGLMKNLKSSLSKFMPGAEQEINNMAEMLGGLMTETFSGDATFGIDESTNAESDKILQEAAAVAETAVDDKFPNTPMDSEIPSTTSRFM
ncbi:MAG: putative cell division protein B2 [Marine Group I thaumarchaeote]|nr:MAG: putative cell division protein B2 [Marine Group I thaumarchaeote]